MDEKASEQQVVQSVDKAEEQESWWEKIWFSLPIFAFILSLAAIGMQVAQLVDRKPQPIHTVDLASISRFYQEQARQQGLQDGITNDQRGQILQNLQNRMNALQQVIDEYVQECGCNLYVQSAIVGRTDSVIDVTQQIVNRVNTKVPGVVIAPVGGNPATSIPLPPPGQGN